MSRAGYFREKVVAPELGSEQAAVGELIERSDAAIFVTGRAGCGKSTLLQQIKASTRKCAAVLAPTGVAALNVRGQTIHSFFKFPPRFIDRSVIRRQRNHNVFQELELLIIDEVSMVRADVMDGIDYALRINRGFDIPFGGVQLVCFGDLFQLPPVVRGRELEHFFRRAYGSPYFFSAHVFSEMPLSRVELTTVYRQTDLQFIDLLDAIREDRLDEDALRLLNRRPADGTEHFDNGVIVLTGTNEAARRINERRLREFPEPAYHYQAELTDRFEPSFYPADADLTLKPGAQVMMLANDPKGRWVNGTLAHVAELAPARVNVRIGGLVYPVEPVSWERVEYVFDQQTQMIQEKSVGSFTQYPVRLAWAITIHKSQGKTFDRVIIDVGRGAFAHGQVYVALSRCRTLDGIRLAVPIRPRDIVFDPQIHEYRRRCRLLKLPGLQ
ncbi:MAG: AAA family ATPase [Candidatus Omnitrophica bacterium]|nr:AAA family ATPase [Candidatus Omnitrophota bacterium]